MMLTNRIRDILLILLAAVAFFVGGSCYLDRRDKNVAERIRAEQNVVRLDSVILRRDTVYRETVRTYTETAARAIAANPGNAPLIALDRQCRQLILSCDERNAAAQEQIAELKRIRKLSLPRFSVYGLGGYDVLNQKPLVQAGADLRLFGPLSLTTFIQAATGDSGKVDTRAVVGGRITFR